MKKLYLILFYFIVFSISAQATVWTVTNSGFTFDPSVILIEEGDSVFFSIGGSHTATEVSQATWNANGSTQLPGGFNTGFGGGLVLPSQLAVGTHYYVCQPHAGLGMKGTIIVQNTTGINSYSSPIKLSLYYSHELKQLSIVAPSELAGEKYLITNLTGKKVTEGLLMSDRLNLSTAIFAAGVYFIIVPDKYVNPLRFIISE